jgi:hypothetical protein
MHVYNGDDTTIIGNEVEIDLEARMHEEQRKNESLRQWVRRIFREYD